MRRVFCSLFAALALAGCASTGYYREDGAADYYYERDAYYNGGYYAGYGVGAGFYDPFWTPGFYLGVSSWPYYGYGYGSYYAGWPYFGYAPWYDSWWGVGYNDWSWRRHQQELARIRDRNAGNEAAAVAGMRGRTPDRYGVSGMNPGSPRFAPEALPNRRGLPDGARQIGADRVDPYYGTPRIRRGDGPQRETPQLGAGDLPQRRLPAREAPGLPNRDDRPFRAGPAFNEGRMGTPTPNAPMRNAAPMRAPAPSFERAPSFTPHATPSAPSRSSSSDGGGRRVREN